MRLKKQLKIAIYSGNIPSTTFIERLIQGLAAKGYNILLFGAIKNTYRSTPNISVVGYKYTTLSKLFHLIKYTCLLSLFKRQAKSQLEAILKAEGRNTLYTKVKYYPVLWHQPDIFHVQWAKSVNEWSWVQAFGIKLVLSLRGAHINYSPIANQQLAAQYRTHFPKVDGFHAVSKAIAEAAQLYGAPNERIQVVYSGLDLKTFNSKVISTSHTFQIISVGRTHWKKGYTYALDACKLLKDAGLSFQYTIIGALGDIELAYQIEDLGLQKQVTLTGSLPFETVQEQIQNADVLILPSVEEGIANVVLEAMALSTLVVTTNCGGMDEVITDGENGFLVPIRDLKALAEKLLYVRYLPKDRKDQLIANTKRTIETQHTSSRMIYEMETLYQKVMMN